jgi:uncharacterized repeat protein (TIGR03803 family)
VKNHQKFSPQRRFDAVSWCAALALGATSAAPGTVHAATAAPSESVLYSFIAGTNDGGHPYVGLIADKAGNFYGTTVNGGRYSEGTVFELSPPLKSAGASGTWTETPLFIFDGANDGGQPRGDLVMDKQGNLYGTTTQGGDAGEGMVFELSPPSASGGSWTESVVYSFTGGSDGGVPLGGVILDKSGNLLGTGSTGGDLSCNYPLGCGVVFKLTPNASWSAPWTETILHTFVTGDGQTPSGKLLLGKKDYIYGTTQLGGDNAAGTVYKLRRKPSSNGTLNEAVLYSFGGVANSDAGTPLAGVIQDKKGYLYGTAETGGDNSFGAVFQLTPGGSGNPWNENILYSFTGDDGAQPYGNVTFRGKSTLIGTTTGSGVTASDGTTAGKYGTVFMLKDDGTGNWNETVLYNFQGGTADGATPAGKLIVRKGAIYGTSLYGGNGAGKGWGTLFRILP